MGLGRYNFYGVTSEVVLVAGAFLAVFVVIAVLVYKNAAARRGETNRREE